jgi:hypothetical protein
MDNNFFDGHCNKENEKNDEGNRVLSSQKADSHSIKENLDDKDQLENTQSYTERQKKVAVKVKWVTYFKSHKDKDASQDDNDKTGKASQTCNRNKDNE